MGLLGLDMTERLHFHFSLSCIGEGNGNPLQCSCLENPRDRGAWWAAVYGVTQNQTWLNRLSSSSCSSRLPSKVSGSDYLLYWWTHGIGPASNHPLIAVLHTIQLPLHTNNKPVHRLSLERRPMYRLAWLITLKVLSIEKGGLNHLPHYSWISRVDKIKHQQRIIIELHVVYRTKDLQLNGRRDLKKSEAGLVSNDDIK